MISIVLYGRNDSYGYNLHKRAALSLNCMAELLTDADDEILFVDYNTPDDFPTFPEAIQDTLTAKAKARLRILRVRPSVHARFKHKTHLLALEPVARNIAVRRSNPANRWILSTNTDMIFVPRNGQSLSEIVRDLPKGYYGIPRFEIPESLWENLDRYDAPGAIRTIGESGWKFHLNEIVYGIDTIKFDAPGDFQLIDRADLHRIHGFNEEMLLGWHVDSNLCKRLFLLYSEIGDLSDRLFGYHCDHTRQVTPAHKRTAVENSISVFFTDVSKPEVPEQANDWGCADASIEELTLASASGARYVSGLASAVAEPMREPTRASYISEMYDKVGYEPEHVIAYLLDALSSVPLDCKVGWFGAHQRMLDIFVSAWRGSGHTSPVLVHRAPPQWALSLPGPACADTELAAIMDQADVFVFDFADSDGLALGHAAAGADDELIAHLVSGFASVVHAEQQRAKAPDLSPRRVIAINAIHNRFESLARGYIEFARSPFSGRLRQGYILPRTHVAAAWLPMMNIKRAGKRRGGTVIARQRIKGIVVSGPYHSVLEEQVAVKIELAPVAQRVSWRWLGLLIVAAFRAIINLIPRGGAAKHASPGKVKRSGAAMVEIRDGKTVLQSARLSCAELLLKRSYFFPLTRDHIPDRKAILNDLNVRIWSSGLIRFAIRNIDLVNLDA